MAAGAPSSLYFINGKAALITLKLPIKSTSIINFISSSPCFSNACAKIATSTPWAPPVYGGSETGERHELLLTRLFEPRPSLCHSNRRL
ncbi:hypothetical protein GOBAR_AA34445 [Gossypium barbadense]|uniref:Uncharacterized protein n=1 Tax=Gossypium barbadense TaxID=3634 RepID=A0A2P5W560_GOSBA|nr:hypothetical protein GOBAR_AA34445 [Gossypium barbadense]